jgi:formylglycine-generating enzyme required for sulfatase activity
MGRIEKTVFISYRRADEPWALAVFGDLTQHGYDVFVDYDGIASGNFETAILENIKARAHFLVLLTPTALERCSDPEDWMRREIEAALDSQRNIVPLMLEGFTFGAPATADRLTGKLAALKAYNGLEIPKGYFPQAMERLRNRFLKVPVDATLHSASVSAQQVAKEQKARAEVALASIPVGVVAEGPIKVDAAIIHGAPDRWFLPGNGKVEWFQDCEGSPEMVLVPAGSFAMGSLQSEPIRKLLYAVSERPQHPVTIARPFAIARHAATRGQFAAFVHSTGHETEGGAFIWTGTKLEEDRKGSWRNPGFTQDDNHPVVCVNFDDARSYAAWLSGQTGREYRLPTEAEWEYCCRAGTGTPFWWGSSITPAQANYDGTYLYDGGGSKGEWRQATVPVSQFGPNPWGLYQVHGNVSEWCEDIWHSEYRGAPQDGSVWLERSGPVISWLRGDRCASHIVRCGSWDCAPWLLRSASRRGGKFRSANCGFRVARTIPPKLA